MKNSSLALLIVLLACCYEEGHRGTNFFIDRDGKYLFVSSKLHNAKASNEERVLYLKSVKFGVLAENYNFSEKEKTTGVILLEGNLTFKANWRPSTVNFQRLKLIRVQQNHFGSEWVISPEDNKKIRQKLLELLKEQK